MSLTSVLLTVIIGKNFERDHELGILLDFDELM